MKKVGVLGCTGEIGKRIVELLQKNYSVKAGFHKVNIKLLSRKNSKYY